jgi:magnesium transporter
MSTEKQNAELLDETEQNDAGKEDTSQADLLDQIVADLDAGNHETIKTTLEETHPSTVANLIESLPKAHRQDLWEVIPEDQEADILTYLHDDARDSVIKGMEEQELLAAAEAMAPEDLAEIIDDLPQERSDALLEALDNDYRSRLEFVLNFEEGSAGRLMSRDVISVRPDVSLAVVLRWLRRHKKLPPHTDSLMVIDESDHYLGKIELADVITCDPDEQVAAFMHPDTFAVLATMSEHEVTGIFERRDLISVAVVNEEGLLLGRITIDDVIDVIREESERALLNSAGLSEDEDMFAPVLASAMRRGIWLGINLITVFAAAWVIGQFEEALDKIVALAVLMPVVASMGGIAGSQTLTLTIRGLALDQIAAANVRWLTTKEFLVGAANGAVWSLVVAFVAYLWFGSLGIALIIGTAMILNLLAAALSGVAIPLLLHRWGIDPALSGAVILTTITDIIGFLSFLGLATIFLL